MKKYLIQTPRGSGCSVELCYIWGVNDAGYAKRIDVKGSQSEIEERELLTNFPESDFNQLELAPGQYHPRMARPIHPYGTSSPGYNPGKTNIIRDSRAESSGHLHALRGQLEQICRVVHPNSDNSKAYGHEIRSVLILACTEVEAQWRGILKANREISPKGENESDPKEKKTYTTNDYVRLAKPMKLDQYYVNLTYYPWLESISPFKDWSEDKPSESLPWYHAYNLAKHDRESHFNEATLERALLAVTGCFVILCAQYGWDFALQGSEALKAFFYLINGPIWNPSEIYVENGSWQPIHCNSLKRGGVKRASIQTGGGAKSQNI